MPTAPPPKRMSSGPRSSWGRALEDGGDLPVLSFENDGWFDMLDTASSNIKPSDDLAQTLLMERDFRAFAQAALPIFVPNRIKWSWPHDAICDHLQAVSRGEIRNLIINLPPRCLKSSLVSVCWPSWEWLEHPELRYLFTSYDLDLTMRDNEYARRIIKSEWYQSRWADRFTLLKEQDAKRLYENSENGRRLASSVGSRATGEGGDRLVVDDPHNVRKAEMEDDRKLVIKWWTEVMSSRVNTEDAVKIITAQRVHHEDVVGHAWAEMLAGGEQYELLVLPMEFDPRLYGEGYGSLPSDDDADLTDDDEDVEIVEDEEEEEVERALTLADFEEETAPLPVQLIPRVNNYGFSDPRTATGELLVPDQWGPRFVAQQKRLFGESYVAQYQQSPTPSEGQRFKEEYWGRYNFAYLWHQGLRPSMIFVDSAYGVDGGDPTGVSVWGTLGGRLYVMAAAELELETPEIRRRLRDIHAKWRVPFMIEKKANGISLIQDLRRGSDDGSLPSLPVMDFIPDGMSKEERAISVVSYVAGRLVFLPEGADWVDHWITQHKQFPRGKHDDLVDTTAMAITWLAKHTSDIGEVLNRPQRAPYGERVLSGAGAQGGLSGGSRSPSAPGANGTPYWSRGGTR